MEEKSRDTSGKFTRTVDDPDVLAAVRAHDPAATSEIAEELGISRQGADRRLRSLRDDGEVSSKKIGASLVWFLPRDTRRHAPSDAGADRSGETPADTTNAESGRTRDESEDLAEDVRRYLEETDTPPKTDHGRSAILDVFRYLREHGTTKTGEIQDAVYPEYTDEWGSARTMWNALDRYLGDVPGIAKGGYGEWTYTGDDVVREELGI